MLKQHHLSSVCRSTKLFLEARRTYYPNMPKRRRRKLKRIKPGALELLYKKPDPEPTDFVPTHHVNDVGYKIPNIQAMFTEDEIKEVVFAEGESDIGAHPFRIFSCMVLERPPIVVKQRPHQEEYFEARRLVKLQQPFPKLFKDLYIEKIAKEKEIYEDNVRTRPLVTQEDLDGNTNSLNRCLDKRLYLVTKRKGAQHWEMPWAERNNDETLFETAERALVSRIGDTIRYAQVTCMPIGHSEMNYTAAQKEKFKKQGVQIFYNRAYYLEGNGRKHSINSELTEDFGWFTKAELKERLNPTFLANIGELLLE